MSDRVNKYRIPTMPDHLAPGGGGGEAASAASQNHVIYVDAVYGNNSYEGTSEGRAVETIAQAIALATVLGGNGRIVIAAGQYAEENLSPPTGWSLEGRDRVATIITGAGGANPVISLTGLQNNVKNLTIAGNAAQTSLIQFNGAGTYLVDNCQLNGGLGAATVGLLNTASLLSRVTNSDINVAVGASTGGAFQVVAGELELQGCTAQSNQTNPVDTGTITTRSSVITDYNIAGAAEGVITLTTSATANIIDSTLNNTNPAGAPNGYGIDNGDASAVTLNLIGARIQNAGTYGAAAIPVIPEGAADPSVINLCSLYAPTADVNQGAAGIQGFENGVFPTVFPGIESPLWGGLGGGATPFAGADEHDMWSAIMRIARTLCALVNTVATGVGAGGGVALGAYAGGQIV